MVNNYRTIDNSTQLNRPGLWDSCDGFCDTSEDTPAEQRCRSTVAIVPFLGFMVTGFSALATAATVNDVCMGVWYPTALLVASVTLTIATCYSCDAHPKACPGCDPSEYEPSKKYTRLLFTSCCFAQAATALNIAGIVLNTKCV